MSGSDAGEASVPEAVREASNILFLAGPMEPGADAACTRLLSARSDAGECLLFVTLSDTPDDRLEAWRAHGSPEEPEELAFITAGDSVRSAAAEPTTIDFHGRTTISALSNPGDLTGLGIETSEFLTGWEDTNRPVRACFHSLTTLLQYVDTQQVFRFLHVLTGRVDAVDARAHYHLDPDAHDERTVNTLKPLFDAVVTVEDGELTARTR